MAVATPDAVGFDDKKLCAVLDEVLSGELNIHSVLVMRRRALAAELYRPGSDRSIYSVWSSRAPANAGQHDMRSVSKSVISLLYGILLSRSEVPDLETPVVSLYPEHPDLAVSSRGSIRIRHLLTMSAGLDWNEPSPVHATKLDDQFPLAFTRSIYRCVFDGEVVAKAGARFVYSGGATSVLADIMTRATGRSLAEIARVELFQPLGITDWSWTNDLRGRPLAYAGLRLKPRDLMKIGLLVYNRGTWKGRQIVPADWIDQATAAHITASPAYSYGYQWWTSTLDWHGETMAVSQAIGNGGQRLFVVPKLDLVVVMTAGNYNELEILTSEDKLFGRIAAAVIR